MDRRSVILFQVFLLAAAFTAGESTILKCYNCMSMNDDNCKDPFIKSSTLVPTECNLQKVQQIGTSLGNSLMSVGQKLGIDIPQGSGGSTPSDWACMKVDFMDNKGKSHTMRGCRLPGSDVPVLDICKKPPSDIKVSYCDSCEGDGCNGAERLGGITALFYLLVPCLVSLKAIAA